MKNEEKLIRPLYKKSIFIFRRDLRIEDNTGLTNAILSSDFVYCFYILDSNILSTKSSYTSFSLPIDPHILLRRRQQRIHLLNFLRESLLDLQRQFEKPIFKNEKTKKSERNFSVSKKLVFVFGDVSSIIKKIIQIDKDIEAIFVNRDYTPYSRKRDNMIKKICESFNIKFIECKDILINEPEEILNVNNKPYRIFSQYYNKAIELPLKKNNSLYMEKLLSNVTIFDDAKLRNIVNIKVIYDLDKFFSLINPRQKDSFYNSQILVGSRDSYLRLVSKLISTNKKYDINKTKYSFYRSASYLSSYLKFGLCSIREVYSSIHNGLGQNHPLLRQLYWRDFFVYIGFHFPFVFSNNFQERYSGKNTIKWKNDPMEFEAWCKGKTGFPIVDAGMRELNETGFMHNRARLITASFLVKDLHVDWRYGERYFALKLVDYDPAINNGNWQWVASTGCDTQPFFRIFNPWLQQKKFDPNCIYIKKWIPELREISNDTINNWHKDDLSIDNFTNPPQSINYPKPIVNHKNEIIITKEMYKTLK